MPIFFVTSLFWCHGVAFCRLKISASPCPSDPFPWSVFKPPLLSKPQEIRNIHNDELMGIRREEEMEMSDEEIEDPPEMKEPEESGTTAFYSSNSACCFASSLLSPTPSTAFAAEGLLVRRSSCSKELSRAGRGGVHPAALAVQLGAAEAERQGCLAPRPLTSAPCLPRPAALVSQVEALKEENDSLRCQLDAYRNEVELLKQEQGKASRDEDTTKEQQLKLLQQALQGMQKVGPGCSELWPCCRSRQRGWDVGQEHEQRPSGFQRDQNWRMGAISCHFRVAKKPPNIQVLKAGTVCEPVCPVETTQSPWVPLG